MNDDDLRTLLHESVSDVHARSGPDEVRRRGRRLFAPEEWLPITVVAAAVAMVLVLGGVSWLSHLGDGTTGGGGGKHDAVATARPGGRDLHVPVYFVGETAVGPRLFLEYHDVPNTNDTALQAAITQALSSAPEDPDYTNPFRDFGVRATTSVKEPDETMVIDLSRTPELPHGVKAEVAPLLVQALVRTAQAARQNQLPVEFLVKGKHVDSILGTATGDAVGATSDDDTLSPVSVDAPADGSTMGGTFTVSGRAATFEGNVVWELRQRGTSGRLGPVVRHGFATADACCVLAPYTFIVSAPPGEYTLVVHDTDESDGEGSGVTEDTKDITVR